ncbi:hypothetical protein LEP1GSC185_3971 [Leptospira licerasiae serovar Varillal str. VAR 010]|nr:hypothetical protein LEP1GSC185_3971 [Leptospira licerasiae serovar Varillal str. VAR 010]
MNRMDTISTAPYNFISHQFKNNNTSFFIPNTFTGLNFEFVRSITVIKPDGREIILHTNEAKLVRVSAYIQITYNQLWPGDYLKIEVLENHRDLFTILSKGHTDYAFPIKWRHRI